MLNKQDGRFTGEKDFAIYYRHWAPDAESKAIIVIIHGYADHCGRFNTVAENLNAAGYDVFAMDLRGHGQSDGTPGDIEDFNLCTADLMSFIDLIKKDNPGKKVFLLGHSLGGSISCLFASKHQDRIEGLVIASSLVYMSQDVPEILKRLARILSKLLPKIPIEDFHIEGLSRVPENIEDYRNDPLTYTGKVRTRMGANMLSLEKLVPQWISGVSLPMFISHGGDDPIIRPEGSKELYDAAASDDKTFKLFPGLYHDVFHEPETAGVMDSIVEWLDARAE